MIAVSGLERSSDNLWSGLDHRPRPRCSPPPRPGWSAPALPAVTGGCRAPASPRRWWPRPPRWSGPATRRCPPATWSTGCWPPRSDLGPTGRDDRFGYGLVDPVAALTAQVPPVAREPAGRPLLAGRGGLRRGARVRPTTTRGRGAGGDPLGFTAPRQQSRWTARAGRRRGRLGAGTALDRGSPLFVALVTGAALVVRRFRQSRPLIAARFRMPDRPRGLGRTERYEQLRPAHPGPRSPARPGGGAAWTRSTRWACG